MQRSRPDPALSVRLCSVRALPGVRAGSGLLRIGSRLLAIQDDAQAVVWIDPRDLTLDRLVLEGSGGALHKRDKPDYEALLRASDGTIYLLGSGSRPNRRRIACLRGSDASAAASVELRDASPLYLAATEALGDTPNIEGALFIEHGSRLRLFHRGAADQPDAWLDFAADTLTLGQPPRGLGMQRFHLGELGGTPLHFTDAALHANGDLLYLAAAEHTADAIADGPVAGSVIGIIRREADGRLLVRHAPILDADGATLSLRKAEGIALDPDGRSGYLITDPDDPARAAELCGFVLEGPWF